LLSKTFDKIKDKKIIKAIPENFNRIVFLWPAYYETKIEKVVISSFTARMIQV